MAAVVTEDLHDTELTVLQEAARLVGRGHDTDAAITGVLRLLSQLLGLNRGRVVLRDPATSKLRIAYAYGLVEEERVRGVYELGEGITGRVMKTGQIAVVQDIDDEPRYLRRAVRREALPEDVVAYLAAPIVLEDTVAGVLAVHRLRRRHRSLCSDLRVLQVVATLLGQVLRIDALVRERTARLESENRSLKNALDSQGERYGILGDSPSLRNALRQLRRVAETPASVLLTGESGTGKEKFARMLHLVSGRRDGPFVAINCAAIPENLLESELFGHEKGSFTGATQAKRGKIELASGGTLFLDEIADLDFELQGKLLRVLEEQVIQRVGGMRDTPVDVRIVTASHKDLQQAVNQNRFRLDLFYRLNVFPIQLPPLRERSGDVRLLARHFLSEANQEFHRNVILGPGVLELLEGYDWPGNIRQLENVIKRAVLLSPDSTVDAEAIRQILHHESAVNVGKSGHSSPPPPAPGAHSEHLHPSFSRGSPHHHPGQDPHGAARPYAKVRADETAPILAALEHCAGNKTRAALYLGMTPRQLRYRLAKLGIDS